MVVEAGQRGAVERAEAQHHALLVRLHAIDAAGEPQRHDGEADQREAAPAGEAPARTAAAEERADVGLEPGDQRIEVGHRARPARAAAERPAGPPPPPQGPPPPGGR